ncbi:hypothetical protein SAMN02745673_00387 [Marinactinospora thermotolerans DSM 45154]|uniref:Uncharacterized protein n=1 Tax=Marinactinospora thermotolerans DSM 45154 TaxID=1122192 RepID=A0A1T4KHX8_9ACTN|nr:hypothetical protein SAMN02745673_00387 [Marinactinospora thermotolerans DSM 45154]
MPRVLGAGRRGDPSVEGPSTPGRPLRPRPTPIRRTDSSAFRARSTTTPAVSPEEGPDADGACPPPATRHVGTGAREGRPGLRWPGAPLSAFPGTPTRGLRVASTAVLSGRTTPPRRAPGRATREVAGTAGSQRPPEPTASSESRGKTADRGRTLQPAWPPLGVRIAPVGSDGTPKETAWAATVLAVPRGAVAAPRWKARDPGHGHPGRRGRTRAARDVVAGAGERRPRSKNRAGQRPEPARGP